MKTRGAKSAVQGRPVVLYRRVSTKKQLKQEYKNQLTVVKKRCPGFNLGRVGNLDLKEVMSGFAPPEKRMATNLGAALRHLKRNPETLMIVSSADRIARRSEVFERIQTQGLGDRIVDISTGKSINDIIAAGEHYRIEAQYKSERQSGQDGISKRIAAGGEMGNPKIETYKKQAAQAKRQGDTQRKKAVLLVVGQQSLKTKGLPPNFRSISDILHQKGVRTGQSLFFTPERLRQHKKNNPTSWSVAAQRFQLRIRRTRFLIDCWRIETRKRRNSQCLRVQLEGLSGNKSISGETVTNTIQRDLVCWNLPKRSKARLYFEIGCRGPPNQYEPISVLVEADFWYCVRACVADNGPASV